MDDSDEETRLDEVAYLDAENSSFNASDALKALGYMPHTHHLVLGRGNGPKVKHPRDQEPVIARSLTLDLPAR